ncbi:uncharacterized protein [Halyomorpha halys]|uniref:uncharacterized protein n=1 Tax=Halyomorpha halys TaxID=286706 RepID=UPI0034D17AB2
MDVRLIEEISRWPILYNTSCKEYKNVQMKNRVWSDITSKLFGNSNDIIEEKVKTKWKNLRDTFVKSLRKECPNTKKWKHEEQMRFLLPHIKTKVSFTDYNEETLDLSVEKRSSSSSSEELLGESLWQKVKQEQYSEEDKELPVEAVMEESSSRRQANNPKRRRKDSFNSLRAAGAHFMDNSEHFLEQVPSTHYNEANLNSSIEERSSSSSSEELPNENSKQKVKREEYSEEDMELPVEAVMEESPSRRQANNPKRRRRDSFDSPVAIGVHFIENSANLLEQSLSQFLRRRNEYNGKRRLAEKMK